MKFVFLALAVGIFSPNLKAQNSPIIVTQPFLQNGFVCYGSTAVVSANVSNANTYQLQIKNQTTGEYSDFGGYSGDASSGIVLIAMENYVHDMVLRIAFANNEGTTFSDDFQVSAQRPTFSIQPQNQTQCYDSDVFYYVDDFGAGGYTYQWQKSEDGSGTSFTNLSNTTKYKNVNSNALKLDNIRTTDNDFFRCKVVDNRGCENISNSATLAINYFGTIRPTATTPFCEGDTVNFYTDAIVGSVDSYSWKARDGSTVFSGEVYEEVSVLSFKVNGIPADLDEVELEIAFTTNLMQADGSLATSTCPYARSRTGYTVNPRPSGAASVVSDSVCNSGSMFLEITDSRTDWNWSASKYGSKLLTGSTYTTPNLTNSQYFYVSFTDSKGCKSIPDSVLAKVNALPNLTLESIPAICPGSLTFQIPFSNISEGADRFSLTLSSGTMDDFVNIIESSISGNPLIIDLPAGVQNGDYSFDLVLTNSTTECSSVVIPVNLYVQKPTLITNSPSSLAICENGSATISVSGSGEGSLTYQWYFGENVIDGANNESYSVSDVALSASGFYECAVNAICGTAVSDQAMLTVNPKTRISSQPQNLETCLGSEATFSIAATGTGTLSYQWKKNGIAVGENSNSLLLPSVQIDDDGAKITRL